MLRAGERGGERVRGADARQAAPARHRLAQERDRRDARHPHPHLARARTGQVGLLTPYVIHVPT